MKKGSQFLIRCWSSDQQPQGWKQSRMAVGENTNSGCDECNLTKT